MTSNASRAPYPVLACVAALFFTMGCERSTEVLSDAEAALRAALDGGASSDVVSLLDADFQWTDARGAMRTARESVERPADLARALREESGAQRYDYGSLVVITAARPDERTMRVWVQRPEGWRLFAAIQTMAATGTPPFAMSSAATADCGNPCRLLPFNPATDAQRSIADTFMRLKMDEWHPNPDDWAPYVLDDVYYVTSAAVLSKQDRLERLKKAQATGAASVPGDPVVDMRIFEFGDAAVMTARHNPFLGGQPYYSVRVWAFRDGRWQLANTQQTSILDVPAAAPANATN